MTKLYFVITMLFGWQITIAQEQYSEDMLSGYLDEIKVITDAHTYLWGIDLYAPIIFVDAKTRTIYSNQVDANGLLRKSSTLYTGVLPEKVNIANTALDWSGKRWAMIQLPLPENKYERANLINHELFHCAQPKLGLALNTPSNNHLDKKKGRIHLRLELQALRAAVSSLSEEETKQHLRNALVFREARYKTFIGADSTENLLELNEGLAEYTGFVLSGREGDQIKNHFNKRISSFEESKTFVRSFAYETTPIYGYLLQKTRPAWTDDISVDTNLSRYFAKAFEIQIPSDAIELANTLSKRYNGQTIIAEESERAELNQQLVKSQIEKFVIGPHFDLMFERMNVSFNPSNLISLDKHGTVYPSLRITDNWGILTVENGALMSPTWDKITVGVPTNTTADPIEGDGWTLQLNTERYAIVTDETGNFFLEKN